MPLPTKQQSLQTHMYSIPCSIENRSRPSWSGGQSFVIMLGSSPPLFAGSWLTPGDWMHDAEDVSSVAAHRVITTYILSMPANRSTLSRLRWFRLARLALCGSKLGFTSGLARMTKTAPLAYTACCCFEQRVNPTTTSREEALSRNQPKEKNQKRDSES